MVNWTKNANEFTSQSPTEKSQHRESRAGKTLGLG